MSPVVGAAIFPTAPLLVPGVSEALPKDLAAVRDAVDLTLAGLPRADAAVLVAVGDPPGVWADGHASLRGFGRPDVAVRAPVCVGGGHRGPLPPGLGVLTLLARSEPRGCERSVLPVAVGAGADPAELRALGAALTARRPEAMVVLAAGDLSAGLDERSPRFRIDGAADWDRSLLARLAAGDAAAVGAMGPSEAVRVAALGWAPVVVALSARPGPWRIQHYSAPRGVGYVVADA